MLEAKEHLSQLREAAARRADLQNATAESGPSSSSSESTGTSKPPDTTSVDPINSSNAVGVSLDSDAYLDQNNQCICESALLYIRSNAPRNPLAISYDMSIPPATHHEATCCSDTADWL